MDLLLIISVAFLLAVFFAGMEAAFSYADPVRLEVGKKTYPFSWKLIHYITRNSSQFSVAMISGHTLALVTTGLFLVTGTLTSSQSFLWHSLVWQIVALVVAGLLAGELLPTLAFRSNPHAALLLLAFPLALLNLIVRPFSWIVHLTVKPFAPSGAGHPNTETSPIFRKSDVRHFLSVDDQVSTTPEPPVEKEVMLLRNALDFSKVKLREIMVPRNEIAVLDINSDIETLREKFVETGFSRILFYEDNKDNIVGYVHTSAIFQKARSVKPFLKNVLIVPDTMAANRLLSRFIREHRSIALVVDEFGGTAGLVTSEDILEEIFGEIEDEHDTTALIDKKINDRLYLFSGRVETDVINEKYRLGIRDSEAYETLAGFILYHHESIPRPGDIITIGRFVIKILKATTTKIELVHLSVSED